MIGKYEKKKFVRNVKYKCPRCNRDIVNCYNEGYALKSSLLYENEKVCPYCKFEEIEMIPLSDEDEEIYNFTLKSGGTKEDFIKYKAKNEGIVYIRSEHNFAAIYNQSYDKDFLFSNNGENPYLKYYLHKEVYKNFQKLLSFEDYYKKYLACNYISKFEDTKEYENEIHNLELSIEKKFPDLITSDESLQKKIENNLLERFGAFVKNLTTIQNASENESYINSLVKLIKLIEENKYELNGQIINIVDLKEPTINVDLADYLKSWLDNFSYEFVVLYFEYWKITKSDNDLKLCLMYLNKYFESYYCFISFEKNNLDFSVIKDYKCINQIELIEKIVCEFESFYRFYDRKYRELPYSDAFNRFGIFNYPKNSFRLRFDKDHDLTKEGFVLVVANMSEYIKLLYIIIKKLKVDLEYQHGLQKLGDVGREMSSTQLSIIDDIAVKFNGVYSKIVTTLYSNKIYSIKDTDSQSKIILVMKILINFIDDLEKYGNLDYAFKNITELKTAIFSNYIDNEYKEEMEDILDKFVIRLVGLVNSKQNLNDDYLKIKEQLILEFKQSQKYKYVQGDIFNTLITAEFLFQRYVAQNENTEMSQHMDFSCISILYYSSLEKLLNVNIYKKYREMLVKNGFKTITNLQRSKVDYRSYFPTSDVSIIKTTFYNKYGFLNESLTIGGLYFFMKIEENSEKKNYIYFFEEIFKEDINIEYTISYLSGELSKITKSRNSAAHGGDIISIETVKVDKQNVFEIEQAKEYKRLLSKTLESLK
jgi:hypothetical protein